MHFYVTEASASIDSIPSAAAVKNPEDVSLSLRGPVPPIPRGPIPPIPGDALDFPGADPSLTCTDSAAPAAPAVSSKSSELIPGLDWMWQHKTRADTAWTDYSRNHNEQLTSAYLRQQEMLVLGVHVSGGNVKHWDVDLTEMEQRPNPMPTARFRRRLVRCYRKSDGAVLPAIGADRVLLWRNKGFFLRSEANYYEIVENHLGRFLDKKKSSHAVERFPLLGCSVEKAHDKSVRKHTFPFILRYTDSQVDVKSRSPTMKSVLLAAETEAQREYWILAIATAAKGQPPPLAHTSLKQPRTRTSLWESEQTRKKPGDVGDKGNRVDADGTVTGNIFAEIAEGTLLPSGRIPTDGWVGPSCMDPTAILDANEHVVAFIPKDPAASLHLLVIPHPRQYGTIRDISALNKTHLELLHHMRDMGEKLLKQYSPADTVPRSNQFIYVFHKPHVISIAYLHLHAIRRPFLSFTHQFKYLPTSPWCASWDGVVEAITTNKTLQPSNPDTLRLSNSFAAVSFTSKELQECSWEFLDAVDPTTVGDTEERWIPFNEETSKELTLLYLSGKRKTIRLQDGSVIDMKDNLFARSGRSLPTPIRFSTPTTML